jgi:DNA polymerase-3 subunit alpha
VDVARKAGVPLAATNDVHYLTPAEAAAQELLVLIQQQRTVDEPNRYRAGTDQRYLKSAGEMRQVMNALPEALDATLEIAERVSVKLSFDTLLLPHFPLPSGFTSVEAVLEHRAREGLRRRYGEPRPEVVERLDYELGVINHMRYAGYFLVVQDFISHARERGIAVGPGRGSAAGSLVAYCLAITDIDPLAFGLLFERFLNPERVTMPDIDVDFDYRRRGEVIDYVKAKYGEDSVTQIITFGTMAARGVIRDVGRALGMEFSELDRIAKLVPAELGITLDRALEQVPELQEVAGRGGKHTQLMETARVLEGLNRHASTHAAGVLIAPGRLSETVPLFKSNKGEVSTQWDMKSVEKVGLLKMDFLGLRTLTVLEDALDLVAERTGSRPDLAAIPLDDAATFDLLRHAQTVGVFQLESAGMRDLLRRLGPESFEDIVAVNALYRPGPRGAGMLNDFIDVKHGKKEIRYEHPLLEPILRSTYGMMVYQEQVMRIASEMAGFSLGEADLLRRAMGKKKPEEMEAQRKRFVVGATARGIQDATARHVFEQMAYFAGYGFNRSHSAAYALISYQTAYLKAHHPAEFLAATLTSEMDTTDRVMILVEECRRLGLTVLPPDVNASRASFAVSGGAVRFGLGGVKNVGVAAIEELVRERERQGPYRGLFDLARRLGTEILNRRVLESLVAAGALDTVAPDRSRCMNAVPAALEAGARRRLDEAMGQTSLFGDGAAGDTEPELPPASAWDRNTRLRHEKEVLGFYLSAHPLDAYRDEIRAVATGDTARIKEMAGGEVRLLGVVTQIVRKTDKKGRGMGFVTLEDFAGTLECVLFSSVFETAKAFLIPDRVVLVRGKLDRRDPEGEPKILAEEVFDFEENRARFAHTLYVRVPLESCREDDLERIGDILGRYPGRGEVVLALETREGRRVRMRVGTCKVGVHPDLLAELRALFGEASVRLGEAVNGRNGG